ncbi:MAG: Rieske 2Fe-2S domain-containing protein [Candidatus Hodarchaeales archaeon]|jgi:nitrite reductase/ring-hydroxylating ferredoxin subunit
MVCENENKLQVLADLSEIQKKIVPNRVKTIQITGSVLVLAFENGEEIIIPNKCCSRPEAKIDEREGFEEYKKYKVSCHVHGTVFDAKTGKPLELPGVEPEGLRCWIEGNEIHFTCPLIDECWQKSDCEDDFREDMEKHVTKGL